MASKPKKQPQRSCVGCWEVRNKKEMLRLVRTTVGSLEYDPSGKKSGRGAYVCPAKECIDTAIRRGALARALSMPVSRTELEEMRRALYEAMSQATLGKDNI
jgi:predicted RNA-binding protein YlxR (DUF448 family)